MSKKGFLAVAIPGCSVLFILFSCLAICCLSLVAVSGGDTAGDINQRVISETSSDNVIAVIDVKGMIAADTTGTIEPNTDMVSMILKKLHTAEDDKNVKAIILDLDTPGGTVYDSDKIAREVKRINAKKPIIAFIESSATSGGYYISAPTSKIVASETSITGSIGVITQVIELDGLYEKLGVNVITITNSKGDVKAFENLDDPKSKDYAVLKQVLDDNYDQFVTMVADGRHMSKTQVEQFGDGSIYSGVRAKSLGLVDELGNFDKAVEVAKSEANINDADVVSYDTYISPLSELGLFMKTKINPLAQFSDKIKTEPGVYYFYLPE